jgi:membrane dipeptidase
VTLDEGADGSGTPRPDPGLRIAQDWIVDAHLDLAWNALQWNRDLRESVQVLRVREAGQAGPGRGRNTVALPELRAGGVRICFATLLARSSGTPRAHVDYGSAEQANAVAHGQLAYYRALERGGHVRVLEHREALDEQVAASVAADGPRAGRASMGTHPSGAEAGTAWEGSKRSGAAVAGAEGPAPALGVVLAMEGADPILDPEDIGEWAAAGLRAVGLAHYGPGRYAGGTGTGSGLTDLGRAMLPLLEQAGLALDLTHLSDTAFWQAIEAFGGPVHASHGNCRTLVPNARQLDDDQIRAVAERGGVIGIALDAWMLAPGWVKGHSTRDGVGLERVVEHVDHVCELLGSTAFSGIGSDLDGGFGTEQCPTGIDSAADLARLPALLRTAGYVDEDIERVTRGNWLRWLRGWLGGT